MKPSEIMGLLKARGFRPRRSLGQHFLLDPNLLRAVADAGEVGRGDAVVEIGTGPGAFTAVLAERAGRVVTIEVDPTLLEIAREVVGERANVAFVAGDALEGESGLNPAIEAAFRAAAAGGLRPTCVSNFPYAVATPLLVRLLERSLVEHAFPLALVAGTVQREVAERLTARPISKEYGVPSVLVQTLAEVRIARRIGPKAFHPAPRVDSAVVRIEPRPSEHAARQDYVCLRALVRSIFQFRRKTVKNALEQGLGLPAGAAAEALARAGVDPSARAEALSVALFRRLAAAISALP